MVPTFVGLAPSSCANWPGPRYRAQPCADEVNQGHARRAASRERVKGQHAQAAPMDIRKSAPIVEGGPVRISGLQRLALIVDLVGFFLPLSFSPGSCAREEDFMVTLTINKDDP